MITQSSRLLRSCQSFMIGTRCLSTIVDANIPDFTVHRGIARENIVLVDDAAGWKQAVKEIGRETIIGFDTESKPATAPKIQSYRTFLYRTSPHLIQIATRDKAYLFSTLDSFEDKSEVKKRLRPILESHEIIKVGFDLRSDIQLLQRNYGLQVTNSVDLATELSTVKGYVIGLPDAAQVYLNLDFKKSKSITVSNWAMPLSCYSDAMLQYAANDAYMALHVYDAWMLGNRVKRPIERLERIFQAQQQRILENQLLRAQLAAVAGSETAVGTITNIATSSTAAISTNSNSSSSTTISSTSTNSIEDNLQSSSTVAANVETTIIAKKVTQGISDGGSKGEKLDIEDLTSTTTTIPPPIDTKSHSDTNNNIEK